MFSHLKWALAVPMIGATLSLAQHSGKKDAPRSNHAEVRLHDGSLVRMAILQDSIDVLTKYGKLTIPLRRYSTHRVRRASARRRRTTNSASDQADGRRRFQEARHRRQAARGHGPDGVSALQKVAAATGDLEVVKAPASCSMQSTTPCRPSSSSSSTEDTIQTVEFTITGRIVSPAIKVRSDTFGEFDLKLCQLRSLHQRTQSGDVEMMVDSSQFGATTDQWFDTGVVVDSNLRLTIRADGQVDLWPQGPGQYITTPKGYSTAGKGGALHGRFADRPHRRKRQDLSSSAKPSTAIPAPRARCTCKSCRARGTTFPTAATRCGCGRTMWR